MPKGMEAIFPTWLWDLLPRRVAARPRRRASAKPPLDASPPSPTRKRYERLVHDMKLTHGIRVNRWRKSNSGCAWQVEYADGKIARLIESPYPRGPVSCAVFLHEVGHHAIGFYRYKPRCYEEYQAWRWALSAMRAHGIPITDRVKKRVDDALRYAVAKAVRRKLKRLPLELEPYLNVPARQSA